MHLAYLAYLTWDPDRNFFVIPYLNHPITWYGLFFAFGFLVAYFLFRKILIRFLSEPTAYMEEIELKATQLTDRLSLLVILGTVIGARLGHVFFYSWPYYKQEPLAIFKIWEGGLASHGGAIGVIIAFAIFIGWNRREHKKLTFLAILDMAVIPTAFVAGCIRIGNFINQEITGIPTDLPWGVKFLHPIDGIAGIPVHPVQLYESASYFVIFGILYAMWRRWEKKVGYGLFSGLFLILVFGSRFLIEYLKMPQNEWLDTIFPLSMGQILSIPFILFGIVLLIWYKKNGLSPTQP